MILDPNSLVRTIENINERQILGEPITAGEGLEAARWIASRQGQKGSYRNMFAPTPSDFEQGIHVFTGEKLLSASARHIMGQEAARAVWLLAKNDRDVRAAYDRATSWMHGNNEFQSSGTFCCGRCTLAYWRHYWVSDFRNKEQLIEKGIQEMRQYRSGDGKWHRFPFFYTIYTLSGIDLKTARDELKYALPVMERTVKVNRAGAISSRRNKIITNVLEGIN